MQSCLTIAPINHTFLYNMQILNYVYEFNNYRYSLKRTSSGIISGQVLFTVASHANHSAKLDAPQLMCGLTALFHVH